MRASPVTALLATVATVAAACVACAVPVDEPGGRRNGSPTATGPQPDSLSVPVDAFGALVVRAVDGDTLLVDRDGRRLRVRLIGIDAPESVQQDAPVECHGRDAAAVLRRLTPAGTRIRAAYEAVRERDRRDRFGRELWDVWLPDGRLLQAVLVAVGAAEARVYGPQRRYAAALDALERSAREQRRGLHTCPPS